NADHWQICARRYRRAPRAAARLHVCSCASRPRRAQWSRTLGHRQSPRPSWLRRARSRPTFCARFFRVLRRGTHDYELPARRRCSRSWPSSFQIGADNIKELLRRFGVQRVRMPVGVDEMRPNVILDDFGHQTGHCAARTGDQVHHLFATRLAVELALNCFDLAPDAAHPRQQLVFLANRMSHTPLITYPPTLYESKMTRSDAAFSPENRGLLRDLSAFRNGPISAWRGGPLKCAGVCVCSPPRPRSFQPMSGGGVRATQESSRFLLLVSVLWVCGQRVCVVQAKRHIHSPPGTPLSDQRRPEGGPGGG